MITFKQFRLKLNEESIQEEYLTLDEAVSIEDNQLKFNYGEGGLLNKLGKHIGKKKFIPFISNSSEFGKNKIYSVYNKGNVETPTEIFKAIKKQSTVTVASADYANFISRTAIFMADKIVRPEKIDVIVTPDSTSHLITDLIKELKLRLPHIRFLPNSYVKPTDLTKITIDYDNGKITPAIVKSLEKFLEKSRNDGKFSMKDIPSKQWGKFILGFIEPAEDIHLKSLVGTKVMVIDDLLSSGATINRIIDNVKEIKYEANDSTEVIGATIFKTG
jgi:hypothetical protein